jgi:hypothetical protein
MEPAAGNSVKLSSGKEGTVIRKSRDSGWKIWNPLETFGIAMDQTE